MAGWLRADYWVGGSYNTKTLTKMVLLHVHNQILHSSFYNPNNDSITHIMMNSCEN